MGPNGSPTCGSEREVKCLFDHVKHSETCLCNRSPVLLYLDGDHHSHTLLPPKEKEKKNFIQHLSKDNFHMLTFTKGHFKAWLTPLLPPPPSDEDEAAGSSSFSCIAISFVAVVSSPLLSLYVLQLFSCFSSPYSLIGSIWDQFLHLLLMIRSGQPYPGYLWLPVAVL